MARRAAKVVGSASSQARRLVVENFAHIRRAEIDFGDLTLLVGQQGSGKSLILQLLKLAVDGPAIV